MTPPAEHGDDARVPPNGSAYEEAMRGVRERNDEARKVGKEERAEGERRVAAAEREEQKRGEVYR